MDQNFMIDPEIIRKIVDSAEIRPGETILEIGAGKGHLTCELAKKAKRVIAVEIDRRLRKHLFMDKVGVISGNILDKIGELRFDKIVANIPYSISEPLMNKLILCDFSLAILTVPKGFAYILTAGHDDPKFSRLSLMAQTFYEVELLFDVPRDAFEPKPKVNSVVISLRSRPQKTLERLLFLQPKKLVKNALREALCDYKKMTKTQSRKAIKSFKSYNLLDKKVMELTTDDWKKMVISLEDYT